MATALRKLAELRLGQGDVARASALAEESLALCQQLGDTFGIAYALADLGIAARYLGDFTRARTVFEQTLALHHELKNVWGIGHSLLNLAGVMREQGHCPQAQAMMLESLEHFRKVADLLSIAGGLEALASLAHAEGQSQRAVRLYATAAALRETLGTPQMPIEREAVEGDMTALRAALEESTFTAAWEAGRARSADDVLAELERT